MNRASSATGWVRNPVMKSPRLDPTQASSYELGWTYNPITGCLNHVNGLCKGGGFPENCWVGVTATNQKAFDEAVKHLAEIEAIIKFVSLEPLLGRIDISSWIGYNTEYEGEKQRGDSLQSCGDGGIGDRRRGEDLENQSSAVRQVERRQQSNTLQSTSSGERHGEISPSENYDRRDKISCTRQQIGLVSLQGADTHGIDNQPQKRGWEGQSSRKSRTSDLQPTDNTFNKCAGENIQKGQTWPISWIIIGAQTKPTKFPEISWVREIVEAANKAGVKIFLKNNLRPLLIPEDCSKPNYLTEDIFWASEKAQLRQEMPSLRG